jgi:hypothetical protein
MDRFENARNLITISPGLPNRRGKRPLTIGRPLHVQCDDHGDVGALRGLVAEVSAWPHIETGSLLTGSEDLISLQVTQNVATEDPSVFITGREFGRVLFSAPTIYLTLPLISAHWAIVRGWAEPHLSSGFGLVPPGVMVVYTPRDEYEAAICRSLFWVSYNFSLNDRRNNSAESNLPWIGKWDKSSILKPVAVAV